MKAQLNAASGLNRFQRQIGSERLFVYVIRAAVVVVIMSAILSATGCVANIGGSSETATSESRLSSSNCSQMLPDGVRIREATLTHCQAEIPKSTIYRDEAAEARLVSERSVEGWDGYHENGFRALWVTF